MFHLKFTGSGDYKGLAIEGPPDLVDVPQEFTMAFWVRPQALSSINYFLNAFNRLYVFSQSQSNINKV
jgi:hypothetical protein